MSKTSTKAPAKTSNGGAALSTIDDEAGVAESRSAESRAASPIAAPFVATQVLLAGPIYQPAQNWFRAFVPTNSRSRIILGTLAETRGAGHVSLFCGARNFNGQDGVLLTVFVIGQPSVIRPTITVTLMQAGATQYGEPVPYTGS